MQKERLERISRRRHEDETDDLALFTGLTISSQPTPMDPDDISEYLEDAERRQFDDAPRSSARQLRRLSRQHRIPADNGYATDDSLDAPEAQDLATAVSGLVEAANGIFDDVLVDAFRDPDVGVRPRFAEWRQKYPEAYSNAFAGLALVGVWEFWTRAEMAVWNPFGVGHFASAMLRLVSHYICSQLSELPVAMQSMDAYRWHQSLASYAHVDHGHTNGHLPKASVEEDDLVAAMVGQTMVPRLQLFARDAYDPYSSRATTQALSMVEEVTYCLDPDGRKFEVCYTAFKP